MFSLWKMCYVANLNYANFCVQEAWEKLCMFLYTYIHTHICQDSVLMLHGIPTTPVI